MDIININKYALYTFFRSSKLNILSAFLGLLVAITDIFI